MTELLIEDSLIQLIKALWSDGMVMKMLMVVCLILV